MIFGTQRMQIKLENSLKNNLPPSLKKKESTHLFLKKNLIQGSRFASWRRKRAVFRKASPTSTPLEVFTKKMINSFPFQMVYLSGSFMLNFEGRTFLKAWKSKGIPLQCHLQEIRPQ